MTSEASLQKKKNPKLRSKADAEASEIDSAARAGLKFASILLLVAESLTRVHQQTIEDVNGLSRSDTINVTSMLGPLARLLFGQFARFLSVQSERTGLWSWTSSTGFLLLQEIILNLFRCLE